MKAIAIELDALERVSFFSRFYGTFSRLGYQCVYFTWKLSCYLKCKKKGLPCFLASARNAKNRPEINQSVCVKGGSLRLEDAENLSQRIESVLVHIRREFDLKYVFIWNGSRVADITALEWARDHQLSTLVFEIANIPGKIQVNHRGVNAQSTLIDDLSFVKQLPENSEEYIKWKEIYLDEKLKVHFVPQSKSVKSINWWYVVDRFGELFMRLPKDNNFSMLSKLFEKAKIRYNALPERVFDDNVTGDYLFFPAQVSNDTQVVINSDVSQIEAVRKAKTIAKSRGLKLIIKAHPAEKSRVQLERLFSEYEKGSTVFSTKNTFQLIYKSKGVVTINSTVGFEARMLNKPVHWLGKSIFKNMTDVDLNKYVEHYLISLDYFDKKQKVTNEIARKLLERANPNGRS